MGLFFKRNKRVYTFIRQYSATSLLCAKKSNKRKRHNSPFKKGKHLLTTGCPAKVVQSKNINIVSLEIYLNEKIHFFENIYLVVSAFYAILMVYD